MLRDLLHAKRVLEPGHLRGRGDVGGSVGGVGADGHAASGAAGGAGARAEAARAEENGVKRAIGAATQHAVVRAGDRRAAFLKSFRRTMFSVISRDSSRRSALHRRGRSLGSSPFPSAVETRSPAAPPSSLVPARARSGRPRSRCRASPPASRGSRFARARRGRSFPAPADPPLPGSSSAPLGTLAAARARRLGARAPPRRLTPSIPSPPLSSCSARRRGRPRPRRARPRRRRTPPRPRPSAGSRRAPPRLSRR